MNVYLVSSVFTSWPISLPVSELQWFSLWYLCYSQPDVHHQHRWSWLTCGCFPFIKLNLLFASCIPVFFSCVHWHWLYTQLGLICVLFRIWILPLKKQWTVLHFVTGIVLCTTTGHRMRMNWNCVKEIWSMWWRSVMMVGMWGQVRELATLVPSLATMLKEYEVSLGFIIELG